MPVGQAVGDDSGRNGHDKQNRNGISERALQDFRKLQTPGIDTVVNAAWVAGKNGNVKPEIVQTLVPCQPDAGAGHRDHQAVEKGDSDADKANVSGNLCRTDWLADLNQRIGQQAQGEQRLVDHRQFHFFARDEELSVDRLNQDEVEISRPDHLAEVGTVRHEQGFDDRVDQHSRCHEGKILGPSPVVNRVDVSVNNLEKRDLSTKPERSRDDVDEEIASKHHLADESVSEKRRPDANVVCLS